MLITKSIPEKLHFGRKYMVSAWTQEALVGMVQRNSLEWQGEIADPNSTFAIDWDTIAKIYRIREGIYRRPLSHCDNCGGRFPAWITHRCFYDFTDTSHHTGPLIDYQEAVNLVNRVFPEEFN